jgi:hypothetical protein
VSIQAGGASLVENEDIGQRRINYAAKDLLTTASVLKMDSSEVNKKLLDLINGNYDPSELNH